MCSHASAPIAVSGKIFVAELCTSHFFRATLGPFISKMVYYYTRTNKTLVGYSNGEYIYTHPLQNENNEKPTSTRKTGKRNENMNRICWILPVLPSLAE